ncbi:Uncharacterised protein [uncultured archaeon]|nr:Uncharacterised protein [uncultured archaeon]
MTCMADIPRLPLLRYILILPIAGCLALIIASNDAFLRALAVAALVAIELIRDAATISAVAGIQARIQPQKRDRLRKR